MKAKKESSAITKLTALFHKEPPLKWKVQEEKKGPSEFIRSNLLKKSDAEKYAAELNNMLGTSRIQIKETTQKAYKGMYRIVVPVSLLSPQLPPDMMKLILKELGSKDLGKVSRVSKGIKKAANEILNERITHGDIEQIISKALTNLNDEGTQWEYLSIKPIADDPHHFLVTRAVTRLTTNTTPQTYKISFEDLQKYAGVEPKPSIPSKKI